MALVVKVRVSFTGGGDVTSACVWLPFANECACNEIVIDFPCLSQSSEYLLGGRLFTVIAAVSTKHSRNSRLFVN